MGHVNNAVYFTYLEQARIRYMQAVGLMSERLSDTPFILAEVSCQYKAPVPFGMPIAVRMRVTEMRNSSFMVEYEIVDQDSGRIMATGRSVNVAYDYAAGKSMPIPPEWRSRIEAFERGE